MAAGRATSLAALGGRTGSRSALAGCGGTGRVDDCVTTGMAGGAILTAAVTGGRPVGMLRTAPTLNGIPPFSLMASCRRSNAGGGAGGTTRATAVRVLYARRRSHRGQTTSAEDGLPCGYHRGRHRSDWCAHDGALIDMHRISRDRLRRRERLGRGRRHGAGNIAIDVVYVRYIDVLLLMIVCCRHC